MKLFAIACLPSRVRPEGSGDHTHRPSGKA
jgi:hypothetical protein